MENENRVATQGEARAAISTGLVQLYSHHYGKGSTKAKTGLVDNVVVCTMRGGFTEAEHTLIERGDPGPVYSIRRAFQAGMGSAFTAVVERALHRRVIARMSQTHIDPDMSVEIFVLEPQAEDPIAA